MVLGEAEGEYGLCRIVAQYKEGVKDGLYLQRYLDIFRSKSLVLFRVTRD